LYISFAKEPCKRDYSLQKRLIILRSPPIVATPYGCEAMSRLLKMMVSFAKEPYKRDYILQKRPIILWGLPHMEVGPIWRGSDE